MTPQDTGPEPNLDARSVSRYGASLGRLARALVGDGAADDLAQETWVRALERPPRASAALGGWLDVVARRLAMQQGRSARRRREREVRVGARRPSASEDAPDVTLVRIEEQRRVLELLADLREPYRTTLYLRFWEDLRPREIARRTSVPVETVKTRLARGLALLRERLDAANEGRRRDWVQLLLPLAFPRGSGGALAGATSAHPWLAGTVVMKKVAFVSACVVVSLVALVWGLRGPGGFGERRLPPGWRAPAMANGPEELTAVPRLPATPVEREEAEPVAATDSLGGLDVRLRTSDGAPAAKVWVEVVCLEDPATREERSLARTDPDGRAVFESLFAGEVRIDVDRGSRFDSAVEAGTTRTVELTLPEAESIAGVVRTPDGAPIAGAQVWIDLRQSWFPRSYLVATTAADGRFSLTGVEDHARIGARARGCFPSPCYEVSTLPVAGSGERTLDIVLVPDATTGAVVGRVVDPAGEPVVGARVRVGDRGGWNREDPAGRGAVEARPVTVLTDETGSFDYPGSLPAGAHPAFVTARGWPIWSGEVEVPAGGTAELSVTLERPATITGVVVGVTGEPVEGVRVVASEEVRGGWHFDPFPPSEDETDAEGRFRLEWVAPGERMLAANDYRRPQIGRALGFVDCPPDGVVDVRLQLDLGVTIQGRVVGPTGQGLAGWRVSAKPRFHPRVAGQTYPRQTVSRSDGTFEVANLDARYRYDLNVSAPREWQTRATAEDTEPGARDVVIEVESAAEASARVLGRVADVSGGVPRDVELVLWEGEPGIGRVGHPVAFDPLDGRFDHGPVIAGRYTLHVTRGGQTLAQGEPVELEEGETRDLGLLQLSLAGRFELTVRGVPGEALAGLTPVLERAGCSTESLRFEGGRFVSRALAPGAWTVELGRGGGWFLGQHEVDVPADGRATLELEARRGVKVPVTCRLADDADAEAEAEAWDGFAYDVWEKGGLPIWSSDSVIVREDGTRKLAGLALPEGSYRIEARTAAGLRGRVDVNVVGPTCAEPVELELR